MESVQDRCLKGKRQRLPSEPEVKEIAGDDDLLAALRSFFQKRKEGCGSSSGSRVEMQIADDQKGGFGIHGFDADDFCRRSDS